LESIVKNTRKLLLISTAAAALMAGAGLASAQGTNSLPQKSPASTAQAPTKAQSAPTAQAPVKDKMAPTAQAPVKEKTAQAPMKEKTAPTAQAPVKEKTAQAPMNEKTAPTAQAPTKVKTAPTAQAPTKEPAGTPTAARDETKPGAPAALSAEQHAKIWSTLRGEKTERLANVPFSTTVGGVVPGTVHLYTMPVSIVEYAPQYRDYEYILVGDEILIIDPHTLRIVAVIAA
jgi:hypothetical protein